MSKITFRADDDLVDRLEACDASKSEVMRRALRTHLGEADRAEAAAAATAAPSGGVDDALADRVDELIAERLDAALDERLGSRSGATTPSYAGGTPGDINVNITLDAPSAEPDGRDDDVRVTRETDDEPDGGERKTPGAGATENVCGGCGESVPADHVYCPNCGEKQSHRAFCECGDELRTDWAFCPGCGRRTPAADVLEDP
jgi:hypothetical protein